MRSPVRLPSFSGVAAGQTATLQLPIGRKYHEIDIPYSGVTLAQMDAIRVIANGKTIHSYSGTIRDLMNVYDKMVTAATAGVLRIPFDRRGLKDRPSEEDTAINTGGDGFQGLSIEIDINAAAAAPAFSGPRAVVSPGTPGPIGTILHALTYTKTASGAGDLQVGDLPYGHASSVALNRMFCSSTVVTAVKLEIDQVTVFDRTATMNSAIQDDSYTRDAQANLFVLDPTETGYSLDAIPMINSMNNPVSDFRYTFTCSAGGTLTIVQETLGNLGN